MDRFATPEELANKMREDVDTAQANQALVDATALVRGVARQTISFVTQETVVVGGGDRELLLPQRPLYVDDDHPLTVVELGDYGALSQTLVEGQDFTVLGSELTRGSSAWSSRLQGWPRRRYPGVWAPRVQITYSHGYREIPNDIVAFVLEAAKAMYGNPSGLRAFTTPEYSETYAVELLGAGTVEQLKRRLAIVGRRRTTFSA